MLRDMKQRRGEYDSGKLAEIRQFGGSEIFMRLTDAKCRACAAWITDVMAMERPWDIAPTPKPDLPPGVAEQITALTMQEQMMTGLPPSTKFVKDVERIAMELVQQEAQDNADKIAKIIEDQLTQGGWMTAITQAIQDDLVTLGTCIIKAPVIRSVRTRKWFKGVDGMYKAEIVEEVSPQVERVSPLDLYPSEDASNVQDAASICELYRVTRRQLRSFRNVSGYSAEAIDDVLENMQGLREWTDIRSERDELEDKDSDESPQTIDVVIFHGDAQGKMLLDWGMDPAMVPDPLEEVAIEAWLIKDKIVRAVVNDDPLRRRPYHKAVLYPIAGSFWGYGIPAVVADIQGMCNAIARALANNVAMASGPQIAVETERLPAGEDGSRIWPWKVWGFDSAYGTNDVPIKFFQPESQIQELIYAYNEFAKAADEVSGIPAYVSGDSQVRGAGKTASGLSMLMTAATKTIRDIISNFDSGIIRPVIEAMFDYNMTYHDNLPNYMGDCRVVAAGVSALQVRDQNAVRLQEFLAATNNPVDFSIMGPERRAQLLRSVAKALLLRPDDVAPGKQEMKQQMMMQQLAAQEQGATEEEGEVEPQDNGTTEKPKDLGPDGQPSQGQDARLFNQ
jgi:hypothetical protein